MDTATSAQPSAPHIAEPTDGPITFDELQMAYRCPGMPPEALRYDITPTGLHYQVIHFDIPATDADSWTLEVGGLTQRTLYLSLRDLAARAAITQPVTLECAGNGRGLLSPRPVSGPWLTGGLSTASWTGVPLREVLLEAGVSDGAVDVVFTGVDHGIQGGEEQDYARALPIHEAMRADVMLAYGMNGEELLPQHGYPLRLIVPGWYGMASVKWLRSIEVIDAAFEGFQNTVAYRYQTGAEDPGEPVTRIRVKSMMVPPGIPEFITQRRIVEAGDVTLSGRAWSGDGDVVSVEVGIDGHWRTAQLDVPLGPAAWRGWSYQWRATSGSHELAVRATDSSGAVQPRQQPWNYQGMGNNTVQHLQVSVR